MIQTVRILLESRLRRPKPINNVKVGSSSLKHKAIVDKFRNSSRPMRNLHLQRAARGIANIIFFYGHGQGIGEVATPIRNP